MPENTIHGDAQLTADSRGESEKMGRPGLLGFPGRIGEGGGRERVRTRLPGDEYGRQLLPGVRDSISPYPSCFQRLTRVALGMLGAG